MRRQASEEATRCTSLPVWSIDTTDEQLELILVLLVVCRAVPVGISWLETLQFGVDGGELTQKQCLLLLGERGSSTAVAILELTSTMESCLDKTIGDMLKTQ